MPVSKDLLDILCCPETKEPVKLVPDDEVQRINDLIAKGEIKRRSGETETQAIDGGLLRQDGKYLYPIRDDIPVMLIDEALVM